MAHKIDEGFAIIDAVRKTKRVVQVGMQRRSAELFLEGKKIMDSGKLGEVHLVTSDWRNYTGSLRKSTLEGDLDWTMWQGSAPKHELDPARYFNWGYELLYLTANYWQVGQPSGIFQFDNMTAGLQPNGQPVPGTGNTFAGFELGAVRQVNFTSYTNTWLPRDNINSLYFQDDWKFSPNLTFNLGLRWSTESPFHTLHGFESNFDPTATDTLTGKVGGVVHPTGGLNQRDLKNFQPRFGFAWHPLQKWVFRGGFGINTVDIRFPNALQQFDEFQAIAAQQRPAGDPRPLFQLSQGPQPVTFNILPNDPLRTSGRTTHREMSTGWTRNSTPDT